MVYVSWVEGDWEKDGLRKRWLSLKNFMLFDLVDVNYILK